MPPLPGTRVVHPDFQAHHQPPVLGQMTAACTVTRPSSEPNSWDDAAGRHVYPAAAQVYAGICRVQRQADGAPVTVADRTATVTRVVVTVPVGTSPAQVNDVVEVTACPDDPDLVGLPLKVKDVRHASIAWQRDLVCDLQPATTR